MTDEINMFCFAYIHLGDHLRKIFSERSEMAKVSNGVETLPKIPIAWVGRTNATDRRQTDRRRTDDDI